MSVKGVLFRFFLVYTTLIIAAGVVINHFGFKGNSGINIAILAGSVIWVCGAFGTKNRRYFTVGEKRAVLLGMVAIDLSLQFLFGAAALSQSSVGLESRALMIGLGFVAILHAVAIYIFVGLSKKIIQGAVGERVTE